MAGPGPAAYAHPPDRYVDARDKPGHDAFYLLITKKIVRSYFSSSIETATAALAESEARYRRLTQLASDWHWEEDEEGRLLDVSGSAMEMLGLPTKAEPADALFMAAMGWDETQREALRKLIANRQPFLDFAFSRSGVNGARQHFRVSGEPIFNESCRFVGYRGIGVEFAEDGVNPIVSS